MKLVLAEPRFLTESISIISEIVNEVTFKVQKNKIDIIAMDPASVALVSFTLLSSAFEEYTVDKPLNLSLSLEQLKQMLRRAKASDIISLLYDDEKNKLKIKMVGSSTRTFNLALLNIHEKEQKLPDLSYPLKITAPTAFFDEAIEDMSVVSDSLSLTAEKDKLIVTASSSLHAAEVIIPTSESTTVESAKDEKITAKYSLEYLKKMIKASKLAPMVQIRFNKDYPLRLDYLVKDKMNLTWILAPRVND